MKKIAEALSKVPPPRAPEAVQPTDGIAEILLICAACQRTVRRQPVSGSRSLKVPVRCTPCGEAIEDSKLALALRALKRVHPKDPRTG